MSLTKLIHVLSYAIIIVLLHASAFAAVKRGKTPAPEDFFYLSPSIGGYIITGSDRHDSGPMAGIRLGYETIATSIGNSIAVEGTLNYFFTKSTVDDGGENGFMLRLDLLYPFIFKTKYVPYLAVGVGERLITGSAGSKASPLLNYGAGVRYAIRDEIALRIDARHLFIYENIGTHNNFEASVGFNYYFDRKKEEKPPPPPPPAKPKPKPVAPKEEPVPYSKIIVLEGTVEVATLPAATPATAEARTAEKPGILLTPGTVATVRAGAPVPQPVQASPQELEQAREAGVLAEPPPPARVSEKVVKQVVVEFDFDRSEVLPKYDPQLKEIAELLKKSYRSSALVEGHSDVFGRQPGNAKLSQKRAANVKSKLVKFGADAARIATVGLGATRPIADNKTADGRAKNRRAVTTVTVIVEVDAPASPSGGNQGEKN